MEMTRDAAAAFAPMARATSEAFAETKAAARTTSEAFVEVENVARAVSDDDVGTVPVAATRRLAFAGFVPIARATSVASGAVVPVARTVRLDADDVVPVVDELSGTLHCSASKRPDCARVGTLPAASVDTLDDTPTARTVRLDEIVRLDVIEVLTERLDAAAEVPVEAAVVFRAL